MDNVKSNQKIEASAYSAIAILLSDYWEKLSIVYQICSKTVAAINVSYTCYAYLSKVTKPVKANGLCWRISE